LAELSKAGGDALPTARLLDRLDRPDEAIEALERRPQSNPDALAGLAALAEMLERRNRIAELAEVAKRIEELSPSFERLGLIKAKLALREKDFAGARELSLQSP